MPGVKRDGEEEREVACICSVWAAQSLQSVVAVPERGESERVKRERFSVCACV